MAYTVLLILSIIVVVGRTECQPTTSEEHASNAELHHQMSIVIEEMNQLKSTVKAQDAKIIQLETTHETKGGVTYIRWGRTTCPDTVGTERVYKGYAGGTHYTHSGGASNYLCLPENPTWDNYNNVDDGVAGEVWGAEYQHISSPDLSFPFSTENLATEQGLHDQNVPCAVCESTKSQLLMVPARNVCDEGWTREYAGYLNSGLVGHADHARRTEYVCVDRAPEAMAGGSGNENGALFYTVEARCGALPCPPYVNGREMTCAVCTK